MSLAACAAFIHSLTRVIHRLRWYLQLRMIRQTIGIDTGVKCAVDLHHCGHENPAVCADQKIGNAESETVMPYTRGVGYVDAHAAIGIRGGHSPMGLTERTLAGAYRQVRARVASLKTDFKVAAVATPGKNRHAMNMIGVASKNPKIRIPICLI